MRTETEITNELNAELANYRANVDAWNRTQMAEHNNKVNELRQELSDFISNGANICEQCENAPSGMIRRYIKVGAVDIPLYEVGCSTCPPVEDGGQHTFFASQGGSPASAVENWNNKVFVSK